MVRKTAQPKGVIGDHSRNDEGNLSLNDMKVLFVCTGNTCRSPMAEALLRHLVGDEMEVKSAGILAFEGSPASPHAIQVMEERGIELNHTARQIDEPLMSWADLILTMTIGHKRSLQNHFPQYTDKVFTLKEYAHSLSQDGSISPDSPLDIDDPFGGDVEQYRKAAQDIEEALKKWLENRK
ncbi:Low molecular weight protein-tyrosine-phosphatase ywlE [[Clostridium] ultunense Esp]|nr:Low molecular weight protein-tyrosine-phosphatase ywlE [[Clostridium] ultunense Esp]